MQLKTRTHLSLSSPTTGKRPPYSLTLSVDSLVKFRYQHPEIFLGSDHRCTSPHLGGAITASTPAVPSSGMLFLGRFGRSAPLTTTPPSRMIGVHPKNSWECALCEAGDQSLRFATYQIRRRCCTRAGVGLSIRIRFLGATRSRRCWASARCVRSDDPSVLCTVDRIQA